jgi:hypothetical protein
MDGTTIIGLVEPLVTQKGAGHGVVETVVPNAGVRRCHPGDKGPTLPGHKKENVAHVEDRNIGHAVAIYAGIDHQYGNQDNKEHHLGKQEANLPEAPPADSAIVQGKDTFFNTITRHSLFLIDGGISTVAIIIVVLAKHTVLDHVHKMLPLQECPRSPKRANPIYCQWQRRNKHTYSCIECF